MTDVANSSPTTDKSTKKSPTLADIAKMVLGLGESVGTIANRVNSLENTRNVAPAPQQVQVAPGPNQQGAVTVLGETTLDTAAPISEVGHGINAIMGRSNNCPVCNSFKSPNPIVVMKDISANGSVLLKAGQVLPPGDKLAEVIKTLPTHALRFTATQDDGTLGTKRGQVFTLGGEQLLGIAQRDKKKMEYGLSGLLTGQGGHPSFQCEAGTFRYATPEEKRPFWANVIRALATRLG